MKISIIDSGGTNINSVMFALDRLGYKSVLTRDCDYIRTSDKVILPGVGSAQNGMNTLINNDLINCIKSLTQPVFGICLGMQLLFNHSSEGDVDMLGIINGNVKLLPNFDNFSVPHIGWNNINIAEHANSNKLLNGLNDENYFYFVHSYYAELGSYTLAMTDYSNKFSAVVQKDNFYGCQFHPEKSGECGAIILKNFLEL